MYNLEMLPRGLACLLQTVLASDSQLLILMKPGSPAVFTVLCFMLLVLTVSTLQRFFFVSFSSYITVFHFILKFVAPF